MLGGNILTNAQGDPISIGVPEPTIIGGMLVTLVASGIYFGKRKLNF